MLNLKNILIFALCCFVFASCSQDVPKGKTQAEVLYKEAQQFVDDGRYILANERLNLLRSQHPYSFYSTHAELLQADILFMQENFVEAAASYILFRDFHPRHKRMAYVVFKIAESYNKQIPDTFDRDLSPAFEAIKYYKEVIQKYPRSEYASGATEKISSAQEMIDLKEKYIADFYFKTKVYGAAVFRYKLIIESINNPDILEHSITRLVEASLLNNNYKECISFAEKFTGAVSKSAQQKLSNTQRKCKERLATGQGEENA